MGLFDVVDTVVDEVSDIADGVKNAAEWIGEAAEKFGLPVLRTVAKSIEDKAEKLVVAPTVILEEGQKRLEKMLKSCGEGNPDHADDFLASAHAFKSASAALSRAYPGDQWSGGTASERYAERNQEQENRVVTLADLDAELQRLVSAEADLLLPIRDSLRIHHKNLADFGSVTQYLGAMGNKRGKALQYALESALVASTLAEAIPEYERMQDEADAIARSVAKVGDEYKKIADGVAISDSANDYDPRSSQQRGS